MADVRDTGFRDLRFPSPISWGASGGEAFQVTVHVTGSGYEYRNADWDEARNEWDVASKIRTQAEHDLLVAFWRTCRGMAYAFRWKAWDDYSVRAEHGVMRPHADDGRANLLFKRYSDGFDYVDRRIVLPVDWTIHPARDRKIEFKVFVDGVEEDPAGYTVDFRNGVVWFDAAPSGVVTWQGEFDVPARFNMRRLSKTLVDYNYYSFEEVAIIELLPEEIVEPAFISGGPPA
ncbi:DUF2460 domain-containing protein [Sinorhizobium fredii]|uniref:DUF2460 domain-containing protein n=1 Tax=Rhizobium fredii TaxID=380 RepID=UPI00129579F4|nr:DUF2460 domain-containing protein [Sinorhizobium fredii]MQW94055.1 TIGR02217 family protein [Sinorhizobium fredii]